MITGVKARKTATLPAAVPKAATGKKKQRQGCCGSVSTGFLITFGLLPMLAMLVQVGPSMLVRYRQRGIDGLLQTSRDASSTVLGALDRETLLESGARARTAAEASLGAAARELDALRSEGWPGVQDRGEAFMRWVQIRSDHYLVTAATAVARSLQLPWTVCKSELELTERTPDDSWRQTYVMDRKVFEIKTPYQQLEIYESRALGRCRSPTPYLLRSTP